VRTSIIAGLFCLGLPLLADAAEPVSQNSPSTSFSTTRKPDEFLACLMPVVRKDFPQSQAAAKSDDREVHIIDGTTPGNLAIIKVINDGRLSSLVLITTEAPASRQGRNIINAARNCS
jgi:hypothetical protein